jgi:hypothetical protein
VRGGAAIGLVLCLLVACGGGRARSIGTETPYPSEISPPFDEILLIAKFVDYKVHFRLTISGDASATRREESWYFKQGKARFDLRTIEAGKTTDTAVFVLPAGVYACSGLGVQAKCDTTRDVESALKQNPVALYQESLFAHPDSFSGVIAEQRHDPSGLHGHCYDVRPRNDATALGAGQFCYTLGGYATRARVPFASGDWLLEITSITYAVPDSDFAVPTRPPASQP